MDSDVFGSNSVNVFLGIGLPWSIAAIYWTAGSLAGAHGHTLYEVIAEFQRN